MTGRCAISHAFTLARCTRCFRRGRIGERSQGQRMPNTGRGEGANTGCGEGANTGCDVARRRREHRVQFMPEHRNRNEADGDKRQPLLTTRWQHRINKNNFDTLLRQSPSRALKSDHQKPSQLPPLALTSLLLSFCSRRHRTKFSATSLSRLHD